MLNSQKLTILVLFMCYSSHGFAMSAARKAFSRPSTLPGPTIEAGAPTEVYCSAALDRPSDPNLIERVGRSVVRTAEQAKRSFNRKAFREFEKKTFHSRGPDIRIRTELLADAQGASARSETHVEVGDLTSRFFLEISESQPALLYDLIIGLDPIPMPLRKSEHELVLHLNMKNGRFVMQTPHADAEIASIDFFETESAQQDYGTQFFKILRTPVKDVPEKKRIAKTLARIRQITARTYLRSQGEKTDPESGTKITDALAEKLLLSRGYVYSPLSQSFWIPSPVTYDEK